MYGAESSRSQQSLRQQIPNISQHPHVHDGIDKEPPFVLILSEINPSPEPQPIVCGPF